MLVGLNGYGAAAAKYLARSTPALLASFAVDAALGPPEGRALLERLTERLLNPEEILRRSAPEDDVLLVLVALVSDHAKGPDAAEALMLSHGLRHAVTVGSLLGTVRLIQKPNYRTVTRGDWTGTIHSSRAFDPAGGESPHASAHLRRLGRHLRAAEPVDQAALRAIVAERVDAMPPSYRRAVAYAFRDPEWSDACVRDALASGAVGEHPAGLVYAGDGELLRAFADRFAETAAAELGRVSMRAFAARHPPELAEAWLLRVLRGTRPKDHHAVLSCLAQLRGPGAAAALAEATSEPKTLPVASRYFERHPDLALASLPGLAARRGKKWDAARGLLETVGRTEAPVDAPPAADEASWPRVLSETPWRAPKRPPIALALTPIEVDELIREKLSDPLEYEPGRETAGEEAYAAAGPRRASRYVLERLPPARVRELLLRDGSEMRLHADDLARVAARFGDELPGICIDIALKWPKRHIPFLAAVRSVRAVRALLPLCDDPIVERDVLPGLAREAATVALALWPIVLAPEGPTDLDRHRAERLIDTLRRRGLELELRYAAARYGPEAKAAAAAFLERDPRFAYAPLPVTSPFVPPASLPPLVLAAGSALPPEAVTRAIEMLRIAGRAGYAGLDELRAAVTADSADAFAWALFTAWERAGMPDDDWPLFAIGHLGAEGCARGLDQRVRRWPTNGAGVARMRKALEALARNGSAEALVRLRNAGERSRYADTQAQVNELLDEVAAARGLTRDELHERTVPALGLEAGWPVLDYGTRKLEVRVGEDLEIFLISDGVRLEKLPKPRTADDPARAKGAKDRFAALTADLREVIESERRHFQLAMRRQRTWSLDDFGSFVAHPLLGRMVRGLVWVADGRLLRVDEAGGFATEEDEAYAPTGRIRLAHPAIDDAAALRRMQAVLVDYRILQPFPQLEREVFRLSDAEARESDYRGFVGEERRSRDLLALLEGGLWSRVGTRGAFGIRVGDDQVQLELHPGLHGSWSASKQRLGALFAFDARGQPTTFATLDPVQLSELLRDLRLGALDATQ